MKYSKSNYVNYQKLPDIHYKLLKDKLIREVIEEAVEQYKTKNSDYINYFDNVNGAYYGASSQKRAEIYADFKQLINKLKVNLNERSLSEIENLYATTCIHRDEAKIETLQDLIEEKPIIKQPTIMKGRERIYKNKYADMYRKNASKYLTWRRNNNYNRINLLNTRLNRTNNLI